MGGVGGGVAAIAFEQFKAYGTREIITRLFRHGFGAYQLQSSLLDPSSYMDRDRKDVCWDIYAAWVAVRAELGTFGSLARCRFSSSKLRNFPTTVGVATFQYSGAAAVVRSDPIRKTQRNHCNEAGTPGFVVVWCAGNGS